MIIRGNVCKNLFFIYDFLYNILSNGYGLENFLYGLVFFVIA